MRLGGWTRVWIVATLAIALAAPFARREPYPTAAYFYGLAQHGIGMQWQDSAIYASDLRVAAAQSEPHQIAIYQRMWWTTTLVYIVFYSLALGAVMLIVGWVRRGFRGRTIEVEVIDP